MPQIQANHQPLTQITIVESEPSKQGEALSLMTERARFMARQPGFISISLHRSLDGRRIVNYVQWQNLLCLRTALVRPSSGCEIASLSLGGGSSVPAALADKGQFPKSQSERPYNSGSS
jgi:hypothetical protein